MKVTALYKVSLATGEIFGRNENLGKRGEKILKACLESKIHEFFDITKFITKDEIEMDTALGYLSDDLPARRSLGLWANEEVVVKKCADFKEVNLWRSKMAI